MNLYIFDGRNKTPRYDQLLICLHVNEYINVNNYFFDYFMFWTMVNMTETYYLYVT